MRYFIKSFWKFLFLLSIAFLPSITFADQVSIDSRITAAFEEIDSRTSAHEFDASELRVKLERIEVEMNQLSSELKKNLSENNVKIERQRLIQSQLVNLSAEYIHTSFKIVDSASDVISKNLTDLASLSSEIRKSGRPNQSTKKLAKRINDNVTVGRIMRNSLTQIRDWSKSDPNLASRFNSLRLIMKAQDRRITIDKARLKGHRLNRDGSVFDRRLVAIDRTVDELGDIYAELIAEKSALKDLRDEVGLAVQLGRLEMTRETVQRAIPKFISGTLNKSNPKTLSNIADRISIVNDSLISQTSGLDIKKSKDINTTNSKSDLRIGTFENF